MAGVLRRLLENDTFIPLLDNGRLKRGDDGLVVAENMSGGVSFEKYDHSPHQRRSSIPSESKPNTPRT